MRMLLQRALYDAVLLLVRQIEYLLSQLGQFFIQAFIDTYNYLGFLDEMQLVTWIETSDHLPLLL